MITGFEIYEVATDYVTADLICWKRYKQPCFGIVEIMLDANPQLAYVHRYSPFIPVGTIIRLPIDPTMLLGIPPTQPQDSLWTDSNAYGN